MVKQIFGVLVFIGWLSSGCHKESSVTVKYYRDGKEIIGKVPSEGIPAWPNPDRSSSDSTQDLDGSAIGKPPPLPSEVSSSPQSSQGFFSNFVGGVLGLSGCTPEPKNPQASCPVGQVATGNSSYPCCYADYPYLCGSPPLCYNKPCGTSGSGTSGTATSGSGGGGGRTCTAQVCCGGLYQCNGRCYATCVPGSQPCCSVTTCVCYTPCC